MPEECVHLESTNSSAHFYLVIYVGTSFLPLLFSVLPSHIGKKNSISCESSLEPHPTKSWHWTIGCVAEDSTPLMVLLGIREHINILHNKVGGWFSFGPSPKRALVQFGLFFAITITSRHLNNEAISTPRRQQL